MPDKLEMITPRSNAARRALVIVGVAYDPHTFVVSSAPAGSSVALGTAPTTFDKFGKYDLVDGGTIIAIPAECDGPMRGAWRSMLAEYAPSELTLLAGHASSARAWPRRADGGSLGTPESYGATRVT